MIFNATTNDPSSSIQGHNFLLSRGAGGGSGEVVKGGRNLKQGVPRNRWRGRREHFLLENIQFLWAFLCETSHITQILHE